MSKNDATAIDHSVSIRHKLLAGKSRAWKRYSLLVIGEISIWKLFKYELITLLFGSLPGALGLALRHLFYPRLFKKSGKGVVFGRNLVIRNGGNIELGDRVFIDDNVLIDARGAGDEGLVIDDGVILNRGAVLISKTGSIHVAANTDVGSSALLISTGGIRIGKSVRLAGDCKIGGSMSRLEPALDVGDMENIPDDNWSMQKFSKGPVIIGEHSVVFKQTIVLDGVTIGRRSMIGANIVLRENVPEETMVAEHQKLVYLPVNSGLKGTAKRAPDSSGVLKESTSMVTSVGGDVGEQEEATIPDSTVSHLVVSAVYAAVDELNLLQGSEQQIVKNLKTDLSELDSMDLVNLIVETEQQVEDMLGLAINLNTEAAITGRDVFKTLQTFIAQVEAIISKRKG